MAAGKYNYRLQRLVRSIAKNTDNGQDEETFTAGAYYWCDVEPTNSRRQRDYGADQTGVDVTISVRNYPALTALDRLTDGVVTYVIESLRRGDNELICDAYSYDQLVV